MFILRDRLRYIHKVHALIGTLSLHAAVLLGGGNQHELSGPVLTMVPFQV